MCPRVEEVAAGVSRKEGQDRGGNEEGRSFFRIVPRRRQADPVPQERGFQADCARSTDVRGYVAAAELIHPQRIGTGPSRICLRNPKEEKRI